MYLIFCDREVPENEKPQKYHVSKRTKGKETLNYYSVTPDPGTVTGMIAMYRDDGFLLAEDVSENYERQMYQEGILTFTNAVEPNLSNILIQKIRSRRNQLLRDSDWTQMPDSPLPEEEKTAWQTYRQALRDVPQQEGFPENVTWPDAPA